MKGKNAWTLLAMASFAMAMTSCGGKQQPAETTSAPAATAPAGKAVDAATAGEITGSVVLDGAAPKMKAINMAAEPNCSKQHTSPVLSEEVVTGPGGALANVVVYVKSGLEGYTYPAPATPATIDQKGCQYHPHIVALEAHQEFQVINSDPTTHNIHPVPKDNQEWNESQPQGAQPLDKTFARPEVMIPVKCNVHPWMKAYIGVFSNPEFAVTQSDGKFNLKDLPPGTYTLEAWHELYGVSDQTVTIGPKETKSVTFTFKAAAPAASGN